MRYHFTSSRMAILCIYIYLYNMSYIIYLMYICIYITSVVRDMEKLNLIHITGERLTE